MAFVPLEVEAPAWARDTHYCNRCLLQTHKYFKIQFELRGRAEQKATDHKDLQAYASDESKSGQVLYGACESCVRAEHKRWFTFFAAGVPRSSLPRDPSKSKVTASDSRASLDADLCSCCLCCVSWCGSDPRCADFLCSFLCFCFKW